MNTIERALYRGKTKEGKWIYGSLLVINNTPYVYEADYGDLDDIDFGYGFIEVIPETVGQWTGELDNEKTKIFSGDIVKSYDYDCIIIVKWNERTTGWNPFTDYDSDCDAFVKAERVRVIGNVHDNPKLKKKSG